MSTKQILAQHALWVSSDGTDGARANLAGANLAGANLARANLEGANLAGANLYGANLYSANLARANLAGANLYSANSARANLAGANLYSAKLEGANLYGAKLEGVKGDLTHIKTILCDTYPVTYTSEVIQIGCQCHKIEEWWEFDDAQIRKMDGAKSLDWWRVWKPILQQIIAASPAIATGA